MNKKTIKELEKEKEAIEIQIKKLQEKEKLKDFISIKYKKKEYRVYKWENKPFKDFPMPEGFDWSEFQEFVDLQDDEKIELEQYPVYYYTKHWSKKQQKKEYCLSGLCLDRYLDLCSYDDDLAYSYDVGRVVLVRSVK